MFVGLKLPVKTIIMTRAADGADVSFRALLHPLRPDAFGILREVVSFVPPSLAAPIVQAKIMKSLGVNIQETVISNTLWKLQDYLPMSSMRAVTHWDNAQLKQYQALAPESNTVAIGSARRNCDQCEKPLTLCAPKDRARLRNVAINSQCTFVNRFKCYGLASGAQFALFQEGFCKGCKSYFLGEWRYKKNEGEDGADSAHHIHHLVVSNVN